LHCSGPSRDLPKAEVLPKPVQELAHAGATDAAATSSGKPTQAKSNEVSACSNTFHIPVFKCLFILCGYECLGSRTSQQTPPVIRCLVIKPVHALQIIKGPSTSKPAKESRARIPIPTPAPSALPGASTDSKPKAATALKPSAEFVSSPESKPPPKTENQGGFKPVSKESNKGAGRHEQGKGHKRGQDAKAETKEGPRPLKRNGAIDRPPTKLQGALPPAGTHCRWQEHVPLTSFYVDVGPDAAVL
jgi:hypothetical protein